MCVMTVAENIKIIRKEKRTDTETACRIDWCFRKVNSAI